MILKFKVVLCNYVHPITYNAHPEVIFTLTHHDWKLTYTITLLVTESIKNWFENRNHHFNSVIRAVMYTKNLETDSVWLTPW